MVVVVLCDGESPTINSARRSTVPADDDITLFPGNKHVCSLLRSTLIALEPSWYYHYYYIRMYCISGHYIPAMGGGGN